MSWPGQIKAGTVSQTPIIGYDLLPTFVALAGGQASGVDGLDVSRVLGEPDWHPDRELIWHFPYYHPEKGYSKAPEQIGVNDFVVSKTRPHSALVRGNEKLLYFYEDEHIELFQLDDDLGEQTSLSTMNPSSAEQLATLLKQHLKESSARYPTQVE
jgi:arylsulfatase A